MPEIAPLKYRAFLSYAHADTAAAKRLHKALEGFKLGKDLIGRVTSRGEVPKSLYPIFRDREDFSGGHTLTDATVAALDQSAALIVLCSSIAATRPAVNEEVRLYRWRHPERPVIPVIVDGDYPANFPPALLSAITPDGAITGEPVTILGPDIREAADGWDAALSKIVAGLTGLAPNDVFDRIKRNQRAAARARAAVAAVVIALTGVGGWFYLDAQNKGATIAVQQQERTDALAIARQMLGANPAQAAMPGAEDNLIAALTAIQKSAAAGDADYKKAFDLLKAGKGAEAVPLLLAAAEEKQKRAANENKEAAEAFRQAAAIAAVAEPWKAREFYAKAAALDPENINGNFQDGYFQQEAGQLAAAEAAYRRVLSLAKPGANDFETYWSRLGIGDIQMERSDLGVAIATYRDAGAIADRLAKADPGNDAKYTQQWQRDLSVSYIKVGDVLVAQGQLPDALKAFKDSLAIADRLAKGDHGNDAKYTQQWQHDLSVSYERVGDVLVAQGQLPDALKAFKDSLAIRDKLAKADPGNAGWQRDLSVSYDRVGDVLVAQGQLPDALKAFKDSLAIRDKLAKADPGNAGWQRDLAISNERIGDVAIEQNDVAVARSAFKGALAAYEALVARNADDTPSLVFSVVPRWRLATLDPANARRHLTSALEILKPLAEANRLDASRLAWIPQIERQLASLEGR